MPSIEKELDEALNKMNIDEMNFDEEVVTKGTKPILVHEKKTKEIKSSVQFILNLKFRKYFSFIIDINCKMSQNSEGYYLDQ